MTAKIPITSAWPAAARSLPGVHGRPRCHTPGRLRRDSGCLVKRRADERTLDGGPLANGQPRAGHPLRSLLPLWGGDYRGGAGSTVLP